MFLECFGRGIVLHSHTYYANTRLFKKFKKDKKIVLIAVKQSGYALEYADEKLKADKKFILAAVKQDVSALEYVDDSLKNDPDILAIVNKKK